MPKKVVTKFNGTGIDVLNAIRNNSTYDYQERVPFATRENFKEVSQAILSSTATMNNFLNQLVNRIGLVMITSKMYTNPLKVFKKGLLEYGETVEEVFVNLTKAELFDYNEEKNPYKRNNPDVRTAFHRLNNEKQYQTTVSESMLRTALLTEEGVLDLVSKIVESLYTSFEYDEFNEMKLLLVEQAKEGVIKPVTIPSIDNPENANEIARVLKEYSNRLRFMNDSFNHSGVMTHTPIEDQYLIMTAKFSAMMDIDVLAKAFNMDKAEFMGNQIIVDDFLDLEGVECMLIDKQFLMIFDNLIRTTEQYNPARLYWNYFLTTRQTFSISPFANAIMFVSDGISNSIKGRLELLPWNEQEEYFNNGELYWADIVNEEEINIKTDIVGEWQEGDFIEEGDELVKDGIVYTLKMSNPEKTHNIHITTVNPEKNSPLIFKTKFENFNEHGEESGFKMFENDEEIYITPAVELYDMGNLIDRLEGETKTLLINNDLLDLPYLHVLPWPEQSDSWDVDFDEIGFIRLDKINSYVTLKVGVYEGEMHTGTGQGSTMNGEFYQLTLNQDDDIIVDYLKSNTTENPTGEIVFNLYKEDLLQFERGIPIKIKLWAVEFRNGKYIQDKEGVGARFIIEY